MDLTTKIFSAQSLEPVLARMRDGFPLEASPAAEFLKTSTSGEAKTAVAFSGGADSLFLLLWWMAWFPQRRQSTWVLHFDHGTRAGQSGVDAERARRMAEGIGFPFRLGVRDGGDVDSEEAFRNRRFAFFQRVMREEGIRHLLLGHQADDVAETFLARAATGSGPEGLAAPRPVSHHREPLEHWRIRPLLGFSSVAIREFLESSEIDVVKDSSNRSDRYLRNRLRRKVLPEWKGAFPERDLLTGVARTRELLEESADYVSHSVERILPGGCRRPALPVSRLGKSHPACVRFAVQRWLAYHDFAPPPPVVESMVQAICGFAPGSGKWAVARRTRVVLERGRLSVEREREQVHWPPAGISLAQRLYLPDGGVLSIRLVVNSDERMKRIATGGVDPRAEALLSIDPIGATDLTVRRRLPGDRLKPLGSPGMRKLKECFVDRKIPREVRDRLPVVLVGGRIAWVPGLPPAERFRVRGSEENLLSLTYESS